VLNVWKFCCGVIKRAILISGLKPTQDCKKPKLEVASVQEKKCKNNKEHFEVPMTLALAGYISYLVSTN